MDKSVLLREVAAFRRNRDAETSELRRAFLLAKFGVAGTTDLLQSSPVRLARLIRDIRHSLSKERMRGLARHRLYDLNRHIALKELLDDILVLPQMKNGAAAPFRKVNFKRRDRMKKCQAEPKMVAFEQLRAPRQSLGT